MGLFWWVGSVGECFFAVLGGVGYDESVCRNVWVLARGAVTSACGGSCKSVLGMEIIERFFEGCGGAFLGATRLTGKFACNVAERRSYHVVGRLRGSEPVVRRKFGCLGIGASVWLSGACYCGFIIVVMLQSVVVVVDLWWLALSLANQFG